MLLTSLLKPLAVPHFAERAVRQVDTQCYVNRGFRGGPDGRHRPSECHASFSSLAELRSFPVLPKRHYSRKGTKRLPKKINVSPRICFVFHWHCPRSSLHLDDLSLAGHGWSDPAGRPAAGTEITSLHKKSRLHGTRPLCVPCVQCIVVWCYFRSTPFQKTSPSASQIVAAKVSRTWAASWSFVASCL